MGTVTVQNFPDIQDPVQMAWINGLSNHRENVMANGDKWQEILNKKYEEEKKAYIEALKMHYEDQEKWRLIQNGIALLQQAAAFAFAEKQREAAREAQEHQNEVWRTEKEWAQRYQDLWFNKYRPIEEAFLDKHNNKAEYEPQYDTVQARALTHIRREFATARERVRQCVDPRCVGFSCASLKALSIAEAQSAVGAIEKGYRAEEARKTTLDAQHDEIMYKLIQLGRGLATESLGALNGAAQAAANAATYKPYAGFEAAVGNTTGYWMGYAANRAESARQGGSLLQRQMNNYMNMGYTGNVGTQTYVNPQYAPNVTGGL